MMLLFQVDAVNKPFKSRNMKFYDGCLHCVKNARICSFSGPYFSAFGLSMQSKFPYSVQMRKVTDQKNSEYGHFLCTAKCAILYRSRKHEACMTTFDCTWILKAWVQLDKEITLCNKCPYLEFLWFVFSRVWAEYGEIRRWTLFKQCLLWKFDRVLKTPVVVMVLHYNLFYLFVCICFQRCMRDVAELYQQRPFTSR